MKIDHALLDGILKDLEIKCIDKIHIEQYIETIAEIIEEDADLDNLSVYNILSEGMKQEQSTVRKKLERTIYKNKDSIKDKLNTEKPTPKNFLSWIINKVKK